MARTEDTKESVNNVSIRLIKEVRQIMIIFSLLCER